MKGFTELVFILDRSGSMSGLEPDTIGGFNSMLEKQKQETGQAMVTTVLFDDEVAFLHDRLPLDKVKPLSRKDYYVRGCTALLDAVGSTIRHIAHIHKYSPPENRPEKVLFVITTDGMENASRKYSYEDVKRLVEKEKSRYGWEFIFLGANIDAVETAGRFGISRDYATNYHSDSEGTALNYEVLSRTVSRVRSMAAPLGADWKAQIEEDFQKRSR